MKCTKGFRSLGLNDITICILCGWWARRDSNLGPRDYESPFLLAIAAESRRNVTAFPSPPSTELPKPNIDTEQVSGKLKKRKNLGRRTDLGPNRIYRNAAFGSAMLEVSCVGGHAIAVIVQL